MPDYVRFPAAAWRGLAFPPAAAVAITRRRGEAPRSRRRVRMRASFLVLALTVAGVAYAQQILQEGFESKGPYWKPGSSDAVFKVVRHALSDETANSGQRSEHLRLQVERGSYIHYT